MGYSHGKGAGLVQDRWVQGCIDQTGSSNVYEVKGVRYFFETTRQTYSDGAAKGAIWKMETIDGKDYASRVSSFRIEADGTITRAPKALKDFNERYRDDSRGL